MKERKAFRSLASLLFWTNIIYIQSGCQAEVVCGPPELGFEVRPNGPVILPLVVKEWAGLEHVLWRLMIVSTMTAFKVCLADPLEAGSKTTEPCPQAEYFRLLFYVKLTQNILPSLVVNSDNTVSNDKRAHFTMSSILTIHFVMMKKAHFTTISSVLTIQ